MIKIACAFTWILDYFLFGTFISFGHYFFGDSDLRNFRSALQLFCYFWTFSDLWNIRDFVYMNVFPASVVSRKKEVIWNKDLFVNMASTRIFAYGAGAALAWIGLLEFPTKGYHPLELFFLAQVEAFITGAVRDFIGMYIAHEWMHRRAYHLHKLHHKTTADVSAITAVYFDWIDLFLENGIGSTLGAIIKYAIFGKGLFVQAFLIQMWFDIGSHSCNPYTATSLNPVIDYFCRSNISHNLHHALNKGHYLAFPWHHVFSPRKREEDTQKYNAIMGTSVF